MASVQALYQLQDVDLQIDQINHQLQDIERRLADDEVLAQARRGAEQAHADAMHTRQHQRDLEEQIKAVDEKIQKEEQSIYGGSVTKSKELEKHQKQERTLRESKAKLETQVIEAMSNLEAAESRREQMDAELKQAEQDSLTGHADLQHQYEELEDKRASLQKKRDTMAATIDQPSLTIYERLRGEKRGRAIAQVQMNVCSGCRITLPSRDLARARSNPGFSYCSSCGRILLVTR